ncbi:putative NADP-dependent malic enzyme [Candidatus Uzinura diaspidicola str. ASNER]|uniref:Putative NADP-dependent malic enzyme n=1 Tax=Candidatus Uzinura diaspidicola str. ASNER TaxID=1133592 RepID=L7VFX2_9FLAO|nr:putative NADP-dependent malic enzyme [Candidatus Uzinura diaspidicola str. ASNER]
MKNKINKEALDYHSRFPAGKIKISPTKNYRSQKDLSLAYSPGVALPCIAITQYPQKAYEFTSKGNLVAIVSNGTAVLGLGDIGELASKPVMEGKGLLFKVFAGVDVFDIELAEKEPENFIQVIKAISSSFGGINLEDIKAPEAFEIERRLKKELNIPVIHDDQHGTAIISGAALINSLEFVGKKIEKIKVVVNGAGAAAISCTRLYKKLGVRADNILMFDRKGIIYIERNDLTKEKKEFAVKTHINLEEALKGADVFIGLSIGNILTTEMLLTMANNPIIFSLANPNPEIRYNLAIKTRPDAIVASGRSDLPNQVNNVLGFPYLFRGSLDVQSITLNEEMKLAAVFAIARLAKEKSFGKESIIPHPLDENLITRVSSAVARAAIKSGVARKKITDWNAYEEYLFDRRVIKTLY